jgi:DNA-directed RNA polymerase subunit RPC12/RpoP
MTDRKYRHRGYQDSDRERDERRPTERRGEPGRPRVEGAPRGRGLGAPAAAVFKCAACGREVNTTLKEITAETTCPGCATPLHSCTNCAFFDPSAPLECRKPVADRIENKAAANGCRLYQPKTVRDLRVTAPASPDDARAAFDALFKKK